MSKKEDGDIFLSDKSDVLLMINKKERKLLKQVLLITMGSKNGKDYKGGRRFQNDLSIFLSLSFHRKRLTN